MKQFLNRLVVYPIILVVGVLGQAFFKTQWLFMGRVSPKIWDNLSKIMEDLTEWAEER